jgi:hypothetical protein
MPVNKNIRAEIPRDAMRCFNIHQPNALANGLRKRIQDIHSWDNPFCEPVVANLRLAGCGDLLSKDGEDSLGGFARLKAGKERM